MNTKVLRDLSYGVYMIATKDNDKIVGCIANSVMQITTNKIAISINHDNYTNKCINDSGKFSISILSENCDPKIIGTFGYNSSKDIDKFKDINYKEYDDVPIIEDSCGYITCKLVNKMDTDTHTVFLGEIISCDKLNTDTPMTYSYYHNNLKGKTPKNAPTYIEEADNKDTKTKNIFVCSVCGYRYETELDELPDDFKCPICGKGKEYFKKI